MRPPLEDIVGNAFSVLCRVPLPPLLVRLAALAPWGVLEISGRVCYAGAGATLLCTAVDGQLSRGFIYR